MHYLIWPVWSILWIPIVQKNRGTSRYTPGLHVTPTVTNQIARCEVDVPFGRRLQKHSGLWFAALTAIRVDMMTNLNIIEGQLSPELGVHGIERCWGRATRRNIGLIGHYHEDETGRLEATNRLHGLRQDMELFKGRGGNRAAVSL